MLLSYIRGDFVYCPVLLVQFTLVRGDILCQCEFVIFEFKLVAYVNPKGEKSDGDFGYYTGVLIAHVGIVSTNVNDCAEHIYSS